MGEHEPQAASAWVVRDTWRRFRAGWQALGPAARTGWLKRVSVGFALCAALSALLTWGVQRLDGSRSLGWEEPVLRRISRMPLLDLQDAVYLGALGATPFLVVLIVVSMRAESVAGRPLRALSLPVGFLGAKALAALGWMLWSRPRPQLFLDGSLNPPLNSFPSGHALQSLVIYGLLTWFWARASRSRIEQTIAWALFLLLVAVIGVSRLRMGAHWPSDVLAGTLLGAAWLAVLVSALQVAARDSAG